MLKKQALLGVIGLARAAVGFLAAGIIIRKYGLELFGEVAFATTYMMLGTVIEAFMFPKLKADIVNQAADIGRAKCSYVETLNICHSINIAMVMPALLLLLLLPIISYQYPGQPSVGIGIMGVVLCFLLSGGAYAEQVYVAQGKLLTYRFYDLLTWVLLLVLLILLKNSIVPLPILAVSLLGGTAIFRQVVAMNLSIKENLKVNVKVATSYLFETKSASFSFVQANLFGVGTSLLISVFVKLFFGVKEFGEFSFLQRTAGAPFNIASQNLGVAWRKHSELEIKGDKGAIFSSYQKTTKQMIVTSLIFSPVLIFVTNATAEIMLGAAFPLYTIGVFVFYGLSQLLFAWSSMAFSMHQHFSVQRDSYLLLFLATCFISLVVIWVSTDFFNYILGLSFANCASIIYSNKFLKKNYTVSL